MWKRTIGLKVMGMNKMRENNMRRARSMKRKILAGMVMLLFIMTVVVPVGYGENDDSSTLGVYRDPSVLGIYADNPLIYTTVSPQGSPGKMLVYMYKAYETSNAQDTNFATEYFINLGINAGDILEGSTRIEVYGKTDGEGRLIPTSWQASIFEEIPGFKKDLWLLKKFVPTACSWQPLSKEEASKLEITNNAIEEITPNLSPKSKVPSYIIEPGGVDFTSIQLNYISTFSDQEFGIFNYALKAKKAEKSDEIIDIEGATELSLNSFFIGLTLPESKFWVNLNPWEPDVIADEDLRKTDMGRIMLDADLQMKKDFCKYKNPCESEIGEEYWELLNKKSEELVEECMKKHPAEIEDTNNVLFSPVTRHWIVPDKTDVYGTDDEVYIVDMTLNIESDPVYEHSTYQIVNQNPSLSDEYKEDLDEAAKEYGRYAMELEEVMILPVVVQEVNHGGYYSDLRQVYISLALAQWYKDKIWHTSGIFTNIIDSNNLTELESKYTWDAEDIWRDYVKSFEEGEYHCWKNITYEKGDYIITESRLYSSGGVDFTDIELTNIGDIPSSLKELTSEAIYTAFANDGDNYYFGDGLYVFYLSSTPTTPEPTKPTQTPPHQNNNVTPLVDTPTSEEDSSKNVPGFKVSFAIVGLLVATYLLRNRK